VRVNVTPDPWLAIGDDVADAIATASPGRALERCTDIHAALLALVADGPRGVVLSAEHLLPRPRAALRALARAAGPHRVVVLSPRPLDPRIARAVEFVGARVATSPIEALGSSARHDVTGTAAFPVVRSASPAASAVLRGPALDEIAFVDGCFRRLDRADDLCRFVLGAFSRSTGAERVSLMLVDPDRSSLFVKAAKGLDPALVGRLRAPLSSGIAGRATSLARALSGRATPGGPRGYAGTAYAVLPLGSGPTCEGVVSLTDLPDDKLPSPEELRVLVRMAKRAGRAVSAARRLEQAETQSATDELTGLPNRRAFERALRREVERARRGGTALAVAILDIDRFKSLNDRFGHPVGDRVLAQVARRLSDSVRETDLVCRWGGEEFAILLMGLAEGTPAEALLVLERSRAAVGGRPLALGPGLPCPMVTISGGFALLPQDGTDGATLVRRADEALYEAKRTGRDRILHILHA
jgi:diguanylate cyclase (GGDEF)-like protein